VVISIIAVLASLLLPALGRAKEKAQSIRCLNRVRQLSLAGFLYAGDHGDRYPVRRQSRRWPTQLRTYYEDLVMLRCTADRVRQQGREDTRRRERGRDPDPDQAFRSYIFNGWNDYFREVLTGYAVNSTPMQAMPLAAIRLPSETILLGEKKSDSDHFYMDLLEPSRGGRGNDVTEIERGRHSVSRVGQAAGGSNYAMADGSARFIRFKGLLFPLNLWAVTDHYRTNLSLSQ